MNVINNFLQQSIKQTRKSIKDIDDSYNNDWDILSELSQNSVDAIRRANIPNALITLIIDSQNRIISIKDNGCGIDPDKLPDLLCPFSTDKEDDEQLIGEKGVGLTFVLFSCDDFYIKSGNSKGSSEGIVTDAYNWKNRNDSSTLPLHHNVLNEKFQGTEIVLKKVAETPIFKLSFNQLKYILRTRTSLGNTNTIWSSDIDIDIELTHIDCDGNKKVEKIPFKYLLPIDGLDNNSKISMDEFNNYIKTDKSDQQKRIKLKDKIIYKQDEFKHNGGRSIKYFSCFVPKRRVWDDLSVIRDICTEADLQNNDWIEKFYYTTFQNGIFTSVKGMPTGISIDHPVTGSQGAWAQIFILFEDRQLKFDIGRKSIHSSQARIYKNYAREIFLSYQKLSKYISGEPQVEHSEWEKDEIFAEIDTLLDLNIPGILLQKTPREQEASVSGLFYECLGNKRIKDIKPLIAGYRNKYDLYAKWGNKKVVIEFKSRLQNILKDFTDEAKLFNEIDCIVCWDVTEEDKQIMSNKGITLDELQVSMLSTSSNMFPSATHTLLLSGFVAPIYIIDLKKVISS